MCVVYVYGIYIYIYIYVYSFLRWRLTERERLRKPKECPALAATAVAHHIRHLHLVQPPWPERVEETQRPRHMRPLRSIWGRCMALRFQMSDGFVWCWGVKYFTVTKGASHIAQMAICQTLTYQISSVTVVHEAINRLHQGLACYCLR